MGELTDVLARLEQHLRVRGARVTEVAHPGIGEGRLDQLLAPLGLSPSASLREWFGWHDGAGEAGAPSAECELAPGCELHPAEVLVAEYVQTRETADLLAFAHDVESRYRTGVLTVGEDGLVQGPVPDHP